MINPHVHTEQEILNSSFDETYGVLTTLPLELNPGGSVSRKVTGNLALVYVIDGTKIYVGEAPIGSATSASVWRAFQFDSSTGAITWADANADFDNAFNNPSALSYS